MSMNCAFISFFLVGFPFIIFSFLQRTRHRRGDPESFFEMQGICKTSIEGGPEFEVSISWWLKFTTNAELSMQQEERTDVIRSIVDIYGPILDDSR